MKRLLGFLGGALLLGAVGCLLISRQQTTAADDGFSLQVTPSPIITSIKPGEKKTVELRIRNASGQPEKLKMGLRSFQNDGTSENVTLDETTAKEVESWVMFSAPVFDVDAGQWFTQTVTFDTPSDAGFSYSFAITISRQAEKEPGLGETSIQGSVAIFTLLNVERTDASRGFKIDTIRLARNIFEYLPVTVDVTVKNTGNTFVQPRGNIFIQRSPNDQEPLAVLPLNEPGSYVLPDTTRTLSASWNDGFPAYQTTAEGRRLVWDWNKLSHLRIGKYTVKVVGIYDDGQRDVPVEAQATFWVIPWKLLIGALAVGTLLIIGIVASIKKLLRVGRGKKRHESNNP